MNPAYKLCLVCDQIRTAAVTFEAFGKAYTYLFKDMDLEVGQEVIVETGNDDTLKVAQVVALHDDPEVDPNFRGTYRWILSDAGKFARENQKQLRDMEAQAYAILRKAERKHAKDEIRKQLGEVYGAETLKSVKALSIAKPGESDEPETDPTA